MDAQEYIKQELDAGRLTLAHVQAVIQYFQSAWSTELAIDGRPGPKTREAIEKWAPSFFTPPTPPPAPDPRTVAPFLSCPLPLLPGRMTPQARKAVITSSFRHKDRPNHNGVDMFYRWETGDEPKFVGDGGCAGKDLNGNPKWVVPYGVFAQAAADGTVQIAGISPTGYRVWIDHGNGLRSGYFHLTTCVYRAGDEIKKGAALGMVGHNPQDTDARHLHFEVSPVEKYEPLDPERYLIK